jgi:hypothetical protein
VFAFYKAFGFFQNHFRNLNVAAGRFVERRADDLALDRALHIGNFLGAFVDEKKRLK